MTTKPLLTVTATPERQGVRVDSSSKIELAVVVDLHASGEAVDGSRPRLSVSFVLDASGSMNGEPIQQVKDSVERLIDLLAPTDQVGVVAFADNPVVVAPLAPLEKEQKQALRRRLQGLQSGGGTGMFLGLKQGHKLLGPRGENERQVIVLLTDGAPTDGSAGDTLGILAGTFRPDVSTTTLGYGPNHQADLLNAIAAGGGGQYWYIPDPKEAQLEFARALGAQGDVVVDGLELVLVPGEGVEILEVLDAQRTRVTAQGLVVPRPDLRLDQTHTTIVRLSIDPQQEARRLDVLKLDVRHRKAGESRVQSLLGGVSVDVVHGEPAINIEAMKKVALAQAEKKRAQARMHADQRRFDAAAVLLKEIVAALEALPGYAKMDGSPVSDAVEQLLDEIQAYETKPTAQQYQEFRSTNLGVDLAQGARHASDMKAQSSTSRALMAGVTGGEAIGFVVVKEKGIEVQRIPLAGELTIGRTQDADICIPRGNVSKRHTRIVARNGMALVVDLKSTNGTYVNGKRVSAPVVLGEQDKVSVGDYELMFEKK